MSKHTEEYEDDLPAWEDMDPLQRAAVEALCEEHQYIRAEDCCSSCGKEFEEFGDLGCGYCDRRHPDWGKLP